MRDQHQRTPNGVIVIRCFVCKELKSIAGVTNEQYLRWKRRDGLIQDIMPHISLEVREMLISGTCPKCFAELFKYLDEEPS